MIMMVYNDRVIETDGVIELLIVRDGVMDGDGVGEIVGEFVLEIVVVGVMVYNDVNDVEIVNVGVEVHQTQYIPNIRNIIRTNRKIILIQNTKTILFSFLFFLSASVSSLGKQFLTFSRETVNAQRARIIALRQEVFFHMH